jgi:hypothetical protein
LHQRRPLGKQQSSHNLLDDGPPSTHKSSHPTLSLGIARSHPFQVGQSDYRILISPAPTRPRAMAYTLSVRDPLPTIPIPLRPGDPEPTLPLNQLLHDLYDRARYDLAIDYSQPPVPPLHDDDMAWARQLLFTQ